MSLLPEIMRAKEPGGITALFMAMKEGSCDSIREYSNLLEEQLIKIRDRMSPDSFADLVLDVALARTSDGRFGLATAMIKGMAHVVDAYSLLLDKVLSLLGGFIPDTELAKLIFKLLSTKDSKGNPALLCAISKDCSSAVSAFGRLLDKLLVMKGRIPDIDMFDMIHKLLLSKSRDGVPALCFALSRGCFSAVLSFSELMDRLLLMRGSVPDFRVASVIVELLNCETDAGLYGLFFAFQAGYTRTVISFGSLIEKFSLLKNSIPKYTFDSMMSDILTARRKDNGTPGILMLLFSNYVSTIAAYNSLLMGVSGKVRREIFCIKDRGSPIIHQIILHNKPQSLISLGYFLDALSYEEQTDLLPEILISKNNAGNSALFIAMQEGYVDCIYEYGALIERQLMTIKKRMYSDDFSNLVLDIVSAKRDDGLSALASTMINNKVNNIEPYACLLEKVLSLLSSTISDVELARLIFKLLSGRDRRGNSALFYALAKGYSDAVCAFGILMDKFLLMKGRIPDTDMVGMIFDLLGAESDDAVSGLFCALSKGHSGTVRAFSKLVDKLFVMRGCIPDIDIANMICKLLMYRSDVGSGLFFAIQDGHADTVCAFSEFMDKLFLMKESIGDLHIAGIVRRVLMCSFCSYNEDISPALFYALQDGHSDVVLALRELIGKFSKLLSDCLSEDSFSSMMLNILMAADRFGVSGVFKALLKNNIDVIGAYNSLLVYAPKEVRRRIFCIKDDGGSPVIYVLMALDEPDSFKAYGSFLQSLSYDEQIELLPELLISKNDGGDPALFVAMQEGRDNCIEAYVTFVEEQLMKIRDRMSHDDFSNLVLGIALAKRSDGVSALHIGMYKNRSATIRSYSGLLDKVLPLLKGNIPDDKLARAIFELLKARTREDIDGLFTSLKRGNVHSVAAFYSLLDKLISMKGCIEDSILAGMVFDLLMCKSGDDSTPGLFVAMQNGHHGAVEAFVKLLEKLMMFSDDVSTGYFNNMLLDIVVSRRSDGVSGLSVALENNFPEVVTSYIQLLKLIPKDELANVLVALNASGIPAALSAGREALEAYFAIISDLSTRTIYALHSQLSSARRPIEHILVGDRDLEGKYKLLLDKIKELARSSRQDH
ncbi:hypothetical protein [Candidatus Ichthyocystis sparus]|uniref:hypothetical protein n=1 Tax=Candidatus Ichthyocystis sparus TaxID=1561004 RepID=UPI001146CD45|nr:hypothetical protein [Candidatus Ichthyocystis sparus]